LCGESCEVGGPGWKGFREKFIENVLVFKPVSLIFGKKEENVNIMSK